MQCIHGGKRLTMPQMSQRPIVTLPMVVYWQENQVAISLESHLPLGADPVDTLKSLNLAVLQKLMQMNGLQLQSFQDEDLPYPTTSPVQTGNGGTHGDGDDDEEDEDEGRKGESSLSGLITGIAQGLIDEGQELLDRAQQLGKDMVERSASSRSSHTASSSSDAGSIDDLNSVRGKYLFRSPRADNKAGTSVLSFFRVAPVGMSLGATMMAARMRGAAMKDATAASQMYEGDNTLNAVKIINSNLDYLQKSGVPVMAAAPNWLNGGTPVWGCGTHGCPVSPPIPVTVDDIDSNCNGNWKLEFTNLPEQSPLLNASGNGVTVLVLDTLPLAAQISAAAAADASNALLQDVNTNVTINYVTLPDKVEIPNPEQPATGKDIYGRLVGFPMNDHGTFVAGEIRNLAPDAHVECIRVLNDAGVGTTGILTDALAKIQQRLLGDPNAGTPLHLPLVINLSLVTTPSDEELFAPGSPFGRDEIYLLRDGLHTAMLSLAQLGVIFVASSGNDSDLRPDASMALKKEWSTPDASPMVMDPASPSETAPMPAVAMDAPMLRLGARFPAAFAYDHPYVGHPTLTRIPGVIPVGAINGQGVAATYSNYSGVDGINTYGGEVPTPKPNPEVVPLLAKVVTDVERPIDAVRGVYTSTRYPYLSMDDILDYTLPVPVPVLLHPYPDYPNPDPSALHHMTQRATWAYWSGTSFATPMVSALAARVLEVDGSSVGDAMRNKLEGASQVADIWNRLENGTADTHGYVVGVQQVCDTAEALLGRE